MKHEILFRGKRTDTGDWAEGSLVVANGRINAGKAYILQAASDFSYGDNGSRIRIGCFVEVDPDTVGQFTGLVDKHGKRIFEGDKVIYDNSPYSAYCEPISGVIERRNGSLCFGYMAYGIKHYRSLCSDDFFAAKCEVIGNTHDSPELMQGGG